jgi:hypothetical protein
VDATGIHGAQLILLAPLLFVAAFAALHRRAAAFVCAGHSQNRSAARAGVPGRAAAVVVCRCVGRLVARLLAQPGQHLDVGVRPDGFDRSIGRHLPPVYIWGERARNSFRPECAFRPRQCKVSRAALCLRDKGRISDEALREIENEVDISEAQLLAAMGPQANSRDLWQPMVQPRAPAGLDWNNQAKRQISRQTA